MSYETILTALADPTRRAVLDRLRRGPQPVGRIADDLPVSRPAVSQHLKVLLDAGLVSVRAQGTRNLYALVPGGAGPLGDWLGSLRTDPADAQPDGAVTDTAEGMLRRSLTTRLTPSEAWALFCDDLSIWWPVARVSLSAQSGGALPQIVTLDARPGGHLQEVLFDGSRGIWATVITARAPGYLQLDWRLETVGGSVVTVVFTPQDGGSRLTLTQDTDTTRTADLWDAVLDRFSAAANSSLSNF